MTFVPIKGDWTFKRIPTKASTAYAVGEVVYSDGTDIIPAVATTEDILGIVMEAKASAANTNPISVAIPVSNKSLASASVGTGTPTAAFVGRLCDLDNSTPTLDLDVSTTTESCCRIEQFVSATKVYVSFSPTKR